MVQERRWEGLLHQEEVDYFLHTCWIPGSPGAYEGDTRALEESEFIECRGKFAKASAKYTPQLCRLFWSSVSMYGDMLYSAGMGFPAVPKSLQPSEDGVSTCASDHEPEVAYLVMIVRSIPLKSDEAKGPRAIAAREKELAGHNKRRTWDLNSVRECAALMNDQRRRRLCLEEVSAFLA